MPFPFLKRKSADPITKDADGFFYPIGAGPSYILGNANNVARLNAFLHIPEVNAIFNLRARAHGNIQLKTVDLKGNPIEKSDAIIDVLHNPNYFQSKEEFFGQTNLFKDIFGDELIYLQILGIKPTGIFSLPPQNITIVNEGSGNSTGPFYLNRKLPQSIVYSYKDTDGKNYPLKTNRLLHLNDNNVQYTTDTDYLRGISKLDALTPATSNISAAYEARNVIIVNRGAIGILSNASKDGVGGSAPMNDTERKAVQKKFANYGLSKGQWQVIITNLALKWQQMAIDVDKMKLFEETREDTLKICDSYGTPYEMLSSIRNTTFDNKKEAQRQWYRDTIIPEASARIAGINKKYDTRAQGYLLVPSFDHLPIFETEKKERSAALLQTVTALTKALEVDAITLDQYKLELQKFGI